jgi:hypothetical protein
MKEDVFQDGIPPLTVPLVPHEGVPQSPGLWLFVDGEWHRIDDLGPTGIEDKSVFVLDGREVDQETNTTSPDQWRQSFLNGSRTVQFGPSIRLDTNLFGGGPSKALGADASSRPAANRSPGRAMTSFTAGIARSDEELEYDKIDDATPGGRDTTWSGTGTVIRAGVAQSLRFGRTLFLRFGYDHERLIETDMARSPAIAAPTGRVLSDGGRLSRHTHVAHARLGWSFRYLSPWAGVRLSRQTVRLTGQAAAEFQVPQGLLEQRISFVNEFKANRVMADFGLDVRIPRTGVFLRAQGATNGSDLRLAVSASHAWFRGR